ncbi:MAG: tetratricopeptide repeat protein [Myxococcota bacterium]|nr:tetratricopeptide repeat protein [Myxococcota bacterium]
MPRRPLIGFALAFGLVAATVAVYQPVTTFSFVSIDDALYVTANQHVQHGLSWEGVRWAFTSASEGNWLPLTWLSHMGDVSLFGMDSGAHHRTNLVWHVLTSLLLFFALASMTGRDGASAVVAALFALHPTHVESVAWIAERKDVLSGFFGIATLALYLGWAHHGGRLRYTALLVGFALGLMAKSMLVTLPFVLLLLDVWPLGRLRADAGGFEGWLAGKGASLREGRYRSASLQELVVEKLPMFAGVLAVSVATFIVQSGRGAMHVASSVELPERIANAVVSWERYALNTLWPVGLSVQVPHPYLPGDGGTELTLLQVGLAALFLLGATIFAIWRGGAFGVGWFWFLGMLVPVIGIVQVGPQGLADRYTYLPAIGLYLVIVFGVVPTLPSRAWTRRWGPLLAAVALSVCALLSAVQVQSWRNSLAVYRHALQVNPGNLAAHYSIAQEYRATDEYSLAKAHYRTVLEHDPGAARAHTGMGVVLRKEGRLNEAATHLERALASQPRLFIALNNLGNVHRDRGRPHEAELQYRAALRVESDANVARLNLARLLQSQGRSEEALELFRQVVRERPRSRRVRLDLARLLLEIGDLEGAAAEYRAILEFAPDDANAHEGLAELDGAGN